MLRKLFISVDKVRNYVEYVADGNEELPPAITVEFGQKVKDFSFDQEGVQQAASQT